MEKLVIDWIILKKAEWTNIFCAYFSSCMILAFAKYKFCAYLECIYFRECRLKENFACIWFCKIVQNSRNVHAKIGTLKLIRYQRNVWRTFRSPFQLGCEYWKLHSRFYLIKWQYNATCLFLVDDVNYFWWNFKCTTSKKQTKNNYIWFLLYYGRFVN